MAFWVASSSVVGPGLPPGPQPTTGPARASTPSSPNARTNRGRRIKVYPHVTLGTEFGRECPAQRGAPSHHPLIRGTASLLFALGLGSTGHPPGGRNSRPF